MPPAAAAHGSNVGGVKGVLGKQQSETLQAQLISPWDGGREQRICRHLFQVSLWATLLGSSWEKADEHDKRQRGLAAPPPPQKTHKYQAENTSYSVERSLTRRFFWTKESSSQTTTLWRPRVHRGHLGQGEETSTITSPCRQSCPKPHLDIRKRSRHRKKKILIKHQAGLSITMLTVD